MFKAKNGYLAEQSCYEGNRQIFAHYFIDLEKTELIYREIPIVHPRASSFQMFSNYMNTYNEQLQELDTSSLTKRRTTGDMILIF